MPRAHPRSSSLRQSGWGVGFSPPRSPRSRCLPSRPLPGPRSLPSSHSPRELGLPLCCPGLFLPRARRGPDARSRALVTTSRRAAPGGPRAAHWSARGWRGSGRGREPISCSQSCTTTKGPGRAGGRQGSHRSAGAGPPQLPQRPPARPPSARRPPASRKCRRRRGARSLPSPPPPPCRDARRPRGPAGDGKPAPLPRDPPRPLLTSRIPEPARTCRESTSRPPVPVSVVAGTWGVPGLRWPLNTSSQTVATAP